MATKAAPTTIQPTDEQIFSVFVSACESGVYGIGAWAEIVSYRCFKLNASEEDLTGFNAVIKDQDGKRHEITPKVIHRGIKRLYSGRCLWGGEPWKPGVQLSLVARVLDDESDAPDADMIVQAGLFGDQVYG